MPPPFRKSGQHVLFYMCMVRLHHCFQMFSQIAKLAKLQFIRTCAKCNVATNLAFFKKKRAIYVFLQSGNPVEKVYNRARVAKKRALHFTSTRPPSFLCYSGLSLLRVSWESPSLSGGHEICYYWKTTHFVNKKLEKLFNIPSSLAPKVILGVHQANPEVTEAVKKYEVKPSMTPIHAIRDRLLQGLDQDYNVIFCFTSLKSCSPPLTSLPSSSPLLPGKSSKTALKTQRSL